MIPPLISGRAHRRIRVLVAAVAGLAVLLAGAGGFLLGGTSPAPGDDSPEAGFARDMQVHHAQAVQMSFLVREKSQDPALRAIAYDIITTQQQQIGQMYGWLEQWGLSQASPAEPMAWMSQMNPASMPGMAHMPDHGDGRHGTQLLADGRMPGMASPAELARLASVDAPTAETLFLQLMIRHHQAGIAMANAILTLSDRPEVIRLARSIRTAQRAEVEQMQQMLAKRADQADRPDRADRADRAGASTPFPEEASQRGHATVSGGSMSHS